MSCTNGKLAAIFVICALSGCAQAGGFKRGDLQNATALAQAGGDSAGAACWSALGGAVAATPQPQNDGLVTLAERRRIAENAVSGPCAQVVLPFLLDLVHRLTPLP
jgi:hypothetical protein